MVIPVWDQPLPTLFACIDATTLRTVGGVPTFVLTNNAKTFSVGRVAGVPVRHTQIEEGARHYATQMHTCVPFDPRPKGGTESTVRLAEAEVVPPEANLRQQYGSFAELEDACEQFRTKPHSRKHRESARVPAEALIEQRRSLLVLPAAPHTMALGQRRTEGTDQTIRFGEMRRSTPPGLVGAEVWVRASIWATTPITRKSPVGPAPSPAAELFVGVGFGVICGVFGWCWEMARTPNRWGFGVLV